MNNMLEETTDYLLGGNILEEGLGENLGDSNWPKYEGIERGWKFSVFYSKSISKSSKNAEAVIRVNKGSTHYEVTIYQNTPVQIGDKKITLKGTASLMPAIRQVIKAAKENSNLEDSEFGKLLTDGKVTDKLVSEWNEYAEQFIPNVRPTKADYEKAVKPIVKEIKKLAKGKDANFVENGVSKLLRTTKRLVTNLVIEDRESEVTLDNYVRLKIIAFIYNNIRKIQKEGGQLSILEEGTAFGGGSFEFDGSSKNYLNVSIEHDGIVDTSHLAKTITKLSNGTLKASPTVQKIEVSKGNDIICTISCGDQAETDPVKVESDMGLLDDDLKIIEQAVAKSTAIFKLYVEDGDLNNSILEETIGFLRENYSEEDNK